MGNPGKRDPMLVAGDVRDRLVLVGSAERDRVVPAPVDEAQPRGYGVED